MPQILSDDEDEQMSQSDNDGNNDDEHVEGNDGKDDEENEGVRRVDPSTSRKRVRNPIPKLNAERLRGPKGIHTIEKYFEGFKFHGKGSEKKDLDRIMKRLEHWAHRLFPKYEFDDFLEKAEILGTKKELHAFLTKYRHDMLTDDIIIPHVDDNAVNDRELSPEPVDAFDLLIAEQIEKTKQATSFQTNPSNSNISNPNAASSQQLSVNKQNSNDRVVKITDEMRKKIEMNRQLAIERRLARLRKNEENKISKTAESVKLPESSATSIELSQSSVTPSVNISQSTDGSQIIPEESEHGSVSMDTTSVAEDDEEYHSTGNNFEMNNSKIKEQALSSNESAKHLLTNEELDREIDNAVEQFMRQKRQPT